MLVASTTMMRKAVSAKSRAKVPVNARARAITTVTSVASRGVPPGVHHRGALDEEPVAGQGEEGARGDHDDGVDDPQ